MYSTFDDYKEWKIKTLIKNYTESNLYQKTGLVLDIENSIKFLDPLFKNVDGIYWDYENNEINENELSTRIEDEEAKLDFTDYLKQLHYDYLSNIGFIEDEELKDLNLYQLEQLFTLYIDFKDKAKKIID